MKADGSDGKLWVAQKHSQLESNTGFAALLRVALWDEQITDTGALVLLTWGAGDRWGVVCSFGLKDEKKKIQHSWKLKFNSRKNLPLTKYV